MGTFEGDRAREREGGYVDRGRCASGAAKPVGRSSGGNLCQGGKGWDYGFLLVRPIDVDRHIRG